MIGVLMDDTDPLVTVMKVEKAPQETYADIGGLDNQIQEIKVFKICTTALFYQKLIILANIVASIDLKQLTACLNCLYRNRWSCLSHIQSIMKRWE